MAETRTESLIARDDEGIPVIVGANTRVEQVVTHVRAYDETPEEVHESLPHLSVEQVEAALRFYEEHRQEIDEDIERRRAYVEWYRKTMGEGPGAARLRELLGRG